MHYQDNTLPLTNHTTCVQLNTKTTTGLTPGPYNSTQDRFRMSSTVLQEYIQHSQWSVTDRGSKISIT